MRPVQHLGGQPSNSLGRAQYFAGTSPVFRWDEPSISLGLAQYLSTPALIEDWNLISRKFFERRAEVGEAQI